MLHDGCIGAGCKICPCLAQPGWQKVRKHLRASPAVLRLPLPCRHRGEATGATRPGAACGCQGMQIPLLACAIPGIGVCTAQVPVNDSDGNKVACCRNCERREA